MDSKKGMRHRNFKINDKSGRITFEDISQCEDLEQLIVWKNNINAKISEHNIAILKAKTDAAVKGIFLEPDKFKQMMGFRKVLGVLSQTIQLRQRQLNFEISKHDIGKRFIEEAQKRLSHELFNEILVSAKSIDG